MVKHVNGRDVDGILLLDKPLGLSSNKALQTVKHHYQARKAGHTGSLDPLATGLLPICLGEATKFSQYLLDADKVYLTRVKLGEKSSTGDVEGEIIERNTVTLDFATIHDLLETFLGEQQQTPSMFSAIKKNGQPLYKLARKGIEVERKSRRIVIHELRLTSDQALFDAEQAIDLYVHCSKGTYIRNLAEDIGEKAGCGAHLLSLRRVKVGQFDSMHELSCLEQDNDIEWVKLLPGVEPSSVFQSYLNRIDTFLLPVDTALAKFPQFFVTTSESYELKVGRVLKQPKNPLSIKGMVRLYEVPCEASSDTDSVHNNSNAQTVTSEADAIFLGLAEIDQRGDLRGKRLLKTN